MLVEFVGGYISNSIAIMTDAAHMLSDVSGLAVSYFALYICQKGADAQYTYGYHQAEVVGAGLSIMFVWFLTGGLILAAFEKLRNPQQIEGGMMFAIATLGLIVNLSLMNILHSDILGDTFMGHGHSHAHGHSCGAHGHEEHDDHDDHDHASHDHDDHDDHAGHSHGHDHGHGHDHEDGHHDDDSLLAK